MSARRVLLFPVTALSAARRALLSARAMVLFLLLLIAVIVTY